MSIKNSGLLFLMMTFSLVNFAYAKNEQPFREGANKSPNAKKRLCK